VVLLQVLPGVGKVAARKALDELDLDENVRIGQLDKLVRGALVEALVGEP
jgi:ribosomal protein S13